MPGCCFGELPLEASLKEMEWDRMYLLLKNHIAASCQLHLARCNQTNHSPWWSMIAFRLACLGATPLLSPSIYAWCSSGAVEVRWRAWEASMVTAKLWLDSLWSLLIGLQGSSFSQIKEHASQKTRFSNLHRTSPSSFTSSQAITNYFYRCLFE